MRLVHLCAVALCALAMSCGTEDRDDDLVGQDSSFLTLTVSPDEIGVGTRATVSMTAQVTRDAAGETCVFSATRGSFSGSGPQASSSATVGIDGVTRAQWYPPSLTGEVRISASVGVLTTYRDLQVTAVPAIVLAGLPDTLSAGASAVFSASVPTDWAGSAVEISSSQAMLEVSGPAEAGYESGTRVRAIISEQGNAFIVYHAPAAPGPSYLTASLFGTVVTDVVIVP